MSQIYLDFVSISKKSKFEFSKFYCIILVLLFYLQMYTGVYKQGFIQPQTLAQQDIVITTYETLRKEIDYVDLPHNNSKRSIDSSPCYKNLS